MKNKYLGRESIIDVVKEIKNSGKTIVLCHGVFDLVHPGHLEHFIQAKEFGDFLIVSLTSDQFVNKGPKRPHFTQDQRAKFLASLEIIDFILISNSKSGIESIELIRPNFYVKGSEYEKISDDESGNMEIEKNLVEQYGGKTVFTHGFTSSSSELLLNVQEYFTSEQSQWMQEFNNKFLRKEIDLWIDKLEKVKPVILGELILDEYIKCRTLGKSSKYPVLAFEKLESEIFPGGSLAIADICSYFCNQVNVPIILDNFAKYGYLFSDLCSTFNIEEIYEDGIFPTIKQRYIELESHTRLLELYEYNPKNFNPLTYKTILDNIEDNNQPLLIADYGHGYFAPEFIQKIKDKKRYICLNTQANAGNYGFNTISKYPRADFISLNGGELELELHTKSIDYSIEIPKRMKKMQARYAVVTLGVNGLLIFDKSNFIQVPAFASNIVDKVGAGDAVFSISALLSYLNAPLEIMGLCASLVASNEISNLGHRKTNHKYILRKSLKSVVMK